MGNSRSTNVRKQKTIALHNFQYEKILPLTLHPEELEVIVIAASAKQSKQFCFPVHVS